MRSIRKDKNQRRWKKKKKRIKKKTKTDIMTEIQKSKEN